MKESHGQKATEPSPSDVRTWSYPYRCPPAAAWLLEVEPTHRLGGGVRAYSGASLPVAVMVAGSFLSVHPSKTHVACRGPGLSSEFGGEEDEAPRGAHGLVRHKHPADKGDSFQGSVLSSSTPRVTASRGPGEGTPPKGRCKQHDIHGL